MFDRLLRHIQAKVQAGEYRFTDHALDEAVEDGFLPTDVEQMILTGEIIERQKDRLSEEWKYVIRGDTDYYEAGEVVVKLDVDRAVIIITVYAV